MLTRTPRCHIERRLRSMTTMNAADLRHAAMNLAKRQTLANRAALEDAQRNKVTIHEELYRHVTTCETCFKSGATL